MTFQGSSPHIFAFLLFISFGTPDGVQAQNLNLDDLNAAAEAGDMNARRDLGQALVFGRGGAAQDIEAGLTFLTLAADAGDIEAKAALGKLLLEGYVVTADPDRGAQLLSDAIDAGHTQARTTLGLAYLWGLNRDEDPGRARILLEEAADRGDMTAVRVLGQNLLGGWVFAQDVDRGIGLLELAGAADDSSAIVSLGNYYFNRSGLSADHDRALVYFESAAELGNGEGLKRYGSALMWSEAGPARAEAYLRRAGELGVGSAWTTLSIGAMYGYLGRNSRSKFDGYAELARAAGENRIAVLEAQRQMWGISMVASGPRTIEALEQAAEAGNADAAKYLIGLVRDGNSLNIRKNLHQARDFLARFSDLLTPVEIAQYSFSIDVASTRNTANYPALAEAYNSQPELRSIAFGQDLYKANANFAFYLLQSAMRQNGTYNGPLNAYATRSTLRGVYRECRTLDNPARCNDTIMRPDIIGALIAR
jgi:TPR repeat protein